MTVQDFANRVRALLPNGWFPDNAPVLNSVLQGHGYAAYTCQTQANYTKNQTRLATATDYFLDLAAQDFYGNNLPRAAGESDPSYRSRITATLLRPKATRQSMVDSLTRLTGQTPVVFEPMRILDTGAYNNVRTLAYNTAGGYGSSSTPFQCFINVVIPSVGMSFNDVYSVVNDVKICGTLCWVGITTSSTTPLTNWDMGGYWDSGHIWDYSGVPGTGGSITNIDPTVPPVNSTLSSIVVRNNFQAIQYQVNKAYTQISSISSSISSPVVSLGTVSGSVSLNCNSSAVFTLTLGSNLVSIQPTASGTFPNQYIAVTVVVTQDATGGRGLGGVNGVTWNGGRNGGGYTPIISPYPGAVTYLVYTSFNGGATWVASVRQNVIASDIGYLTASSPTIDVSGGGNSFGVLAGAGCVIAPVTTGLSPTAHVIWAVRLYQDSVGGRTIGVSPNVTWTGGIPTISGLPGSYVDVVYSSTNGGASFTATLIQQVNAP